MSRILELHRSSDFQEEIPFIVQSPTPLLLAADVVAPDFIEIDDEAYFCPPAQLSDLDDFVVYIRDARSKVEIESVDPYGWKRAATIGEVDWPRSLADTCGTLTTLQSTLNVWQRLLARTWASAFKHQFPDRQYAVTSEGFDSESITGPFVRYERTH